MLNAKQKHRKLTFSSQRRGRCIRISMGSVSAVSTMNSAIPRLSVLVAEMTISKCSSNIDRASLTLVSTLLDLLVLTSLLDQVQNLLRRSALRERSCLRFPPHLVGQCSVCQRPSLAVLLSHYFLCALATSRKDPWSNDGVEGKPERRGGRPNF